MKKMFAILLCGLMIVSVMCGCDQTGAESTEPSETEVTYPYDFTSEEFFYIKEWYNYIPLAPLSGVGDTGTFFELKTYTPEGTEKPFYVMQGGCCDGEYAYFILEGSNVVIDEINYAKAHVLFKVDMKTWTVVDQSDPIPMGHGNGMCYNSKLDRIIISYCNDIEQTEDVNETKVIGFMDPDTLEIVDTKVLDFGIYAIDYNEKRDLYVVGIKGNPAAFAVLSNDFVELGYYDGTNVNLGSQDVGCDDNYIYVGNSGVVSNPGLEVVKVYDWDGEYKGIFRVDSVSEQEAIFNWGNDYYITFYTGGGGRVYKIEYDFDLLGD
jgi:hypothetical protein